VVLVVFHAELTIDDLGHTRTGPQVGGVPKGLGSTQEAPFQLPPGTRIELRGPTGGGSSPETFRASTIEAGAPPSDRAAVDVDYPGDLNRLATLLQQSNGSNATTLQLLRASGWSHRYPSRPEDRTFILQESIKRVLPKSNRELRSRELGTSKPSLI
jgi:hypothetical protein